MGAPEPVTVTTYKPNGTVSVQTYPAPSTPSPGPTPPIEPPPAAPISSASVSSPSAPPPPPPPAPILPSFQRFNDNRYDIKVAPRDTVVFDQDQDSIQLIQQLMYEELGGVELANMSRTDLIDGQQVSYSAIANLLDINRMYNPNNIVASGDSQNIFSVFSIDLLSRGISIPEFDTDGNIVIKIDNLNEGELIEYQIALNGTIDRVDEA